MGNSSDGEFIVLKIQNIKIKKFVMLQLESNLKVEVDVSVLIITHFHTKV